MSVINFNLRLQYFRTNILPATLILHDKEYEYGNGFLIKDYFITAGHCLNNGPIIFEYNNIEYSFDKNDAIFFKSNIYSTCPTGDIAIFKFKNEKYLEVAPNSYELEKSTKLILAHYTKPAQYICSKNEKKCLDVDLFTFNTIIKEAPNFFESSTTAKISGGSSGSPLLNENLEVVGILVGCLNSTEKPNVILFNDIRQFINKLI